MENTCNFVTPDIWWAEQWNIYLPKAITFHHNYNMQLSWNGDAIPFHYKYSKQLGRNRLFTYYISF